MHHCLICLLFNLKKCAGKNGPFSVVYHPCTALISAVLIFYNAIFHTAILGQKLLWALFLHILHFLSKYQTEASLVLMVIKLSFLQNKKAFYCELA